jgi:drug/metabolite transporter (DMT)-like permease
VNFSARNGKARDCGQLKGNVPARMKPLHLILLVFANCLWAATYSVFKVLSPALDAGAVATLRFGLAGAVLCLCWPWLPGKAPRGREWIRAVVMGVLAFGLSPRSNR